MMQMTTQSFCYKRKNPQDLPSPVQATCFFFVNKLQIASEYALDDQRNSTLFGDVSIFSHELISKWKSSKQSYSAQLRHGYTLGSSPGALYYPGKYIMQEQKHHLKEKEREKVRKLQKKNQTFFLMQPKF